MKQAEVKINMEVRTTVTEDAPEMLIDPDVREKRKEGLGRVWHSHMTQAGLWYVIHTDDTVAPYWDYELEPVTIIKEPQFPCQ